MIFCDEHDYLSNVVGTCGAPNPEIYLHGVEPYCDSRHEKEPSEVSEKIP